MPAMPGKTRCLLVLSLAVLVVALGSQTAAATTFCVPTVAACPGGTGVAKADLEEAMGANGNDGQADVVYVGAGTYSEDGDFEPSGGSSTSFEPAGADPLTVIGAGVAETTLTSAANTNSYLVNFGYSTGKTITFRDLTIEAPASFPDGLGTAIALYKDDTLEDVVLISFNDESDGVRAVSGTNTLRHLLVRGGGLEGSIQDAISDDAGTTTVEDSTIEGASWGLIASGANAHLIARRVTESATEVYGALATAGLLDVENSVLQVDNGIGLYAGASSSDTVLTANHVTVVNTNGDDHPAMELKRFGSSPGDMTIDVSNSILRGFGSGYKVDTVIGPGIGTATLNARYSNFQNTGTSSGSLDLATGNIDTDPLLLGDYSLPSNSPSVDAGDPAAGGLATDFLGAPRPNDGDGDGVAVRDQGAFEYQRPAPPKEEGGGGGGGSAGGGGSGGSGAGGGAGNGSEDTTPPQTTIANGPGGKLAQGKAKFSLRSSEKGSSFVCKLDRGKAKPCVSPKAYKGLKPGAHTFKVWATDAAGNKDPTPAKRRFKVPA